jgi:transcriptional regulator with XRE-family HTH domain
MIGKRVKELRAAMDITQGELGDLIGGIPHQSIQNVESGKVTRPRYLDKMAEVLGTTVSFLIDGAQSGTEINKVIFKQCIDVVQKVGSDLTPDQQINLVVYLYDECIKSHTEATPDKVRGLISIFT